jgi:hypothetical protein
MAAGIAHELPAFPALSIEAEASTSSETAYVRLVRAALRS